MIHNYGDGNNITCNICLSHRKHLYQVLHIVPSELIPRSISSTL